jgi:hypothetical protein
MEHDPQLYDLLSHLANQEPTKATELFRDMLETRIGDSIRDYTQNHQFNIESPAE